MKNLRNRIVSLVCCLAVTVPFVTLPVQAAEPKIKNVIYMMPDGGGFGQFKFANRFRELGGFDTSVYPTATVRTAEDMFISQYLAGAVRTKSASAEITDSAAGGTAYATGIKTNNGWLSVDPNRNPKATLLEAAQEKGMRTGLVSQAQFYHASPAAFSAHLDTRNYNDILARQVHAQGIDVVLCGGYGVAQAEDPTLSIEIPKELGYTIVKTSEDLAAVKSGDKIWADIANATFGYDYVLPTNEPKMTEIVDAAIRALDGSEEGFFLFVEVSHTDNHGNDARHAASEYNVFSDCFEIAVNYAKQNEDTIVIGIPDHDTGGMYAPPEIEDELVEQVALGRNPTNMQWLGGGNHTSQNVPCFMYAPEGIDLIPGLNPEPGYTEQNMGDYIAQTGDYVIENTDMAAHVCDIMGFDLDALTEELFVDVTEIGTINPDGSFEFASGDKVMYPNESVYYKNGEEISTEGRISLYLDDKFYVPSCVIEENDWNYKGGSMNGFFGSGTEEDPYLIKNPYDFIEFSYNLSNGEDYDGAYFEQTKDIDLVPYGSEYTPVPSTSTFAGTYNGAGYTINAESTVSNDGCIFPTVSGTIMNVGTTGTLTSKGTHAAGICRKLMPSGKLVNSYSTMAITGNAVGGLVYNQYGKVANCYFGGTIVAKKAINALGMKHGNGKFTDTYYIKGVHQYAGEGITAMTTASMLSGFADTLNAGVEEAATVAGVATSDMAIWAQGENQLPELDIPDPVVEYVTVTPSEVTVKKGETVQLSATVVGKYDPSQEVGWQLIPESTDGSSVNEDGLLVISETETQTEFTVLAKSKADGSKAGSCTITITE